MDRFRSNLLYKCIKLDDARTIVHHSLIVHNSVSYLDLSTCEYTSYLQQIRGTSNYSESTYSKSYFQTEEDSRRFFIKERDILYVFHLDLSKDMEPRLRNGHIDLNLEAEGKHECFYVCEIKVSDLCYKRKVQDYLIPFLRQTDRKIKGLRKLHHARLLHQVFSIATSLSFSYGYGIVSNILCWEKIESGNVNGILLEVNSHDQFTIAYEADALLYETFGKESVLQNNMYDMIFELMFNFNIHPLPTLCLYGYTPRFYHYHLQALSCCYRLIAGYLEEQLGKGFHKGVWSVRKKCLLMLVLKAVHKCEGAEMKDLWRPTCHVFRIIWRSFPDPFLSRKEVEYACKDFINKDLFNLLNDFCENIYLEYPLHPTPRSLKHYSRIVIRTCLKDSGFLPKGISSLHIGKSLQSYLRLQ